MRKNLKEVREGAMLLSWGTALQAEGIVSAVVLRQGCLAPGRNHKAGVEKTEQKGVQISKGLAGLSKEGGEPQRVLRRGRKRMPVAPTERQVECSKLRNLELSWETVGIAQVNMKAQLGGEKRSDSSQAFCCCCFFLS